MPFLKWKTYVRGSDISQLSATHGSSLKCSSFRTSGSKMSSAMRSDWESVPTRGSRFTGLLSMSITSVPGEGRLEQETSGKHSSSAKTLARRPQQAAERLEYPGTPLCSLRSDIGNFSQHRCPLRPGC